MRTEEWCKERIIDDMVNIRKLAPFVERKEKGSPLRDMALWNDIETLCDILEIDSLPYWTELCKDFPNLGEVTEERVKELLFDGVACNVCSKLLVPTRNEVRNGWAYGVCCFCGAKLPPLHIAEEVT